MQEEPIKTKGIVLRLPWYLWEELVETTHVLKRRSPEYRWSSNKVICEALRQWIIGVKKKLGLWKEPL
jgi:hypothetical protein